VIAACECALLAWVVRPWRANLSRGRFLVGLIFFAPWAALCLLTLMHQSPFYAAHALWLLGGVFGLLVAAIFGRRRAA
jgi:hypothetical protein